MKRYIITILIIAGAALTVSAQEQTATPEDCEAYKDGHFVVKESLIGKKYIIKRKGNRQVETDPDGTKFIFKVDWTDGCTYTLNLKRIAKNPNGIEWQDGQTITVKILDTQKNGYTQQSTSNFDNLTFVKEMVKVNPASLKGLEIDFEDDVTIAQ
jgi:hypothetical protein